MSANLDLLAELLDDAARAGCSLSPFAERHGVTLDDAYAIQTRLVARRLARGEAIAGAKLGFTSEAMRRQMNVREPNIGWLTDAMFVAASEIDHSRFIHPRIEPEIAVRLGRDLPEDADFATARRCVAAYAPAIEIVDSRFHDYRFHWLDNVADNSSASGYALGAWIDGDVEVGDLAAALSIDGAPVAAGSTADVSGHPLNALREGARIAARLGKKLTAGMVVLTGGVTAAQPLGRGQRASADFANFGRASLHAV